MPSDSPAFDEFYHIKSGQTSCGNLPETSKSLHTASGNWKYKWNKLPYFRSLEDTKVALQLPWKHRWLVEDSIITRYQTRVVSYLCRSPFLSPPTPICFCSLQLCYHISHMLFCSEARCSLPIMGYTTSFYNYSWHPEKLHKKKNIWKKAKLTLSSLWRKLQVSW